MMSTFLGTAGDVTAFCLLAETGSVRFVVDCGKFPGACGENHPALLDAHQLDFMLSPMWGWLSGFAKLPRKIFVAHGETKTARLFAGGIRALPGRQAEPPLAKREALA